VDQPPLAVLLARTTGLFGVNPAAIRILSRGRRRGYGARCAS
jgi:hypothetical protein